MKMTIKIIAVHPATVVVTADERQFELPIKLFSTSPAVGQTWTISLEHNASEAEQLDQLNRYLAHGEN